MATRSRPPAMRQPTQFRDNLPLTDPGLILKEKIEKIEAAAAAQAPTSNVAPLKDDLADPGMVLKKKIQSGQVSKGAQILTTTSRRSALASAGPPPATSSSSTKGSTPYKLRDHRTKAAASSVQAVGESSSVGEPADELTLTKEEQQNRDLFGEDYEPKGPGRRSYTPQLTETELETRSVDQLESYAVLRSQDVSQNIRDCVQVAEETTGIASATMEMLHDQGGQIKRSHVAAVKVEDDLHVGEKLLGSLGGLFSRRWKPKKGTKIKGPQVAPDSYKKKNFQAERKAMLSKEEFQEEDERRARARANKFEGLSATQVQLEMEREHQDEALSGLGDIVTKLKDMTYVMNEEVEKQTVAIGGMEDDVAAIDNRVKQAYNRTRYLVGR